MHYSNLESRSLTYVNVPASTGAEIAPERVFSKPARLPQAATQNSPPEKNAQRLPNMSKPSM